MSDLYKKAGVDYTQLEPFKMAMIEIGKKTTTFPNKRDVYINKDVMHSHGAVFEYRGSGDHMWCKTQEGLGNKNWVAEWMYQKTGKSYYDQIAIDLVLMSVNDCIAQGAMPVVITDHIEASSSVWFADEKRSKDFANGFLKICKEIGIALPAGESAALKYLIKPTEPIKEISSLSTTVTGIIAPKSRLITGKDLGPGDHIIAVNSSGIHSNGVSLVIQKSLELPLQFLTKLPNGNTLGEEILIPTRSYVALIEKLLDNNIKINALLPGTGGGMAKIAFDKREYQYRVHSWVKIPPLMEYFHKKIGLPLKDCLEIFNWGAGYYIFAASKEVEKILKLGKEAGYELKDVGTVEEGRRQVIFEPENIILTPPGE